MTSLIIHILGELYKQATQKTWAIFLFTIPIIIVLLMFKELNINILTGIQIGSNGYNPYYWLVGSSLSNLMLFILPIGLAMFVFVSIKQNENYQTWTNRLTNQNIFYTIVNKLIALVLNWTGFCVIIYSIIVCISLIILKLYPSHFASYEINTSFILIWFTKYYISSLGAIGFCFMLSLYIKNKPLIIIITTIIPYFFIFLSRKGYLLPLSYPYFSTSQYNYNYINYLKGETATFTPQIITGYEILSILIFALVIAIISINRNFTVSKLIKA